MPALLTRTSSRTCHILTLLIFGTTILLQQGQAQNRRPRIYKAGVTPNWFAADTHFWYRNELADGRNEFVLVDAVKGIRKPAFDHEKLGQGLRDAGLKDDFSRKLALDRLNFDLGKQTLAFRTAGRFWRCELKRHTVKEITPKEFTAQSVGSVPALQYVPLKSTQNGPETYITFVNRTPQPVELFWVDQSGKRHSYGRIEPGREREQHTFAFHVWEVADPTGELLVAFVGSETQTRAVITGKVTVRRQPPGTERPPRATGGPRDRSPDQKWRAFIRAGNVFVAPAGDNTEAVKEKQLSTDGTPEIPYGMLEWAGDSSSLVAFRITPGDRRDVFLIESSP
ncbi:MAG: hypothetical protein VB858_13300, partial [Planctomycetaceae bacterium]